VPLSVALDETVRECEGEKENERESVPLPVRDGEDDGDGVRLVDNVFDGGGVTVCVIDSEGEALLDVA